MLVDRKMLYGSDFLPTTQVDLYCINILMYIRSCTSLNTLAKQICLTDHYIGRNLSMEQVLIFLECKEYLQQKK